jgi:integrase
MAIRSYGLTEDSKKRYERFVRWFENWGVIKTFEDINELNIIKMNDVLMERKLKPYSAWNNYHRFLVSFILDAIKHGIMKRNPYEELHIDKEPTSNALDKVLTIDELKRIEAIIPNTEYMKRTKDLFIFQAYTGLSYCDLMAFDASRIKIINGKPVYSGRRGKTKKEYTFLLLKPALQILEANGGVLPKMSNQKYNVYLKALAMAAGITKPVSNHWARHTCATILFNNSLDIEIVRRVLGHSSTKVTRDVYAKLLDETVVNSMSVLDM